MERLKAALEHLDIVIDGLYESLDRRNKNLEQVVDQRAGKRLKAASETAERAVKQAQQREAQATAKMTKQQELTSIVTQRLDQAIMRLEKIMEE